MATVQVKIIKEYAQRNGNSGAHFTIPVGTIGTVDESDGTIEEETALGQNIKVEDFQPVVRKGNTDKLNFCYIPPEYFVVMPE